MQNKQFDEAIRRRIRAERVTIRPEAEERLREKMNRQARIEPRVRRVRRPMRLVVAVLAAVMLITGTALAARYWGSLSLLTHADEEGQPQVNEALAEHIQPVDAVTETEALSVDVVDAIMDEEALVLAWTVTNNLAEKVYLICDIRVNGAPPGMGSYTNVSEVFVEPGETIQSGISAMVEGVESTGDCDIRMTFTALTPNGEVVEIGGIAEDGDADVYRASIDRLLAEGKIPVAGDGLVEIGTWDQGETLAENLVAKGMMDEAGTVDTDFSVEYTASADTAWTPVEKDNGDYILRVAEVDINLNSARFRTEVIFPDREAMEQYQAYYGKSGLTWDFDFLGGPQGDIWWAQAISGSPETDTPQEREDGTWVWRFTTEMMNIQQVPQTITVVPTRHVPGTDVDRTSFPEEGLTFEVE